MYTTILITNVTISCCLTHIQSHRSHPHQHLDTELFSRRDPTGKARFFQRMDREAVDALLHREARFEDAIRDNAHWSRNGQ